MSPRLPTLVDTSYVLALVNPRDQWHGTAVRWRQHLSAARLRLIVTEHILMEIGNALSGLRYRPLAARMITGFRNSKDTEVVPASAVLFDTAFALYGNRPDKSWGLTDCASFVVMQERGLTEALTCDDHF